MNKQQAPVRRYSVPDANRVKGYTFRSPAGVLDQRVCKSIGHAQDNAAWACERPYSYIKTPSDWHRAYRQGFRIVPVTVIAGTSRKTHKRYHKS